MKTTTQKPIKPDTIRVNPQGTPYRVVKVFKEKVHVVGSLGGRVSMDVATVAAWVEAEIPKTLKKGEKVFRAGNPVTVTGFEKFPFGHTVLLTEASGSEMAWPACQSSFLNDLIYRMPK